METIEHFAKISLVTRQLGREHLLSRDESIACRTSRQLRHQSARADLRDGSEPAGADQADCQIVEAPESRSRLVPTDPSASSGSARMESRSDPSADFGRGNSAIIPRAYGTH
jgi:hypothetical protein